MKYISTLLFLAPLMAQQYDIVLTNGRVMDPESGLDAVRNVGIRAGRISAVDASPLQGRTVVDVKGLVVAPGFIDLHVHSHSAEAYAYKARDGVTTALELEIGVWPVAPWYAERQGKSLINFGASSGHVPATMKVMGDTGKFLPMDAAVNRAATPDEVRSIREHVKQGLDDGALAIGFGINYLPNCSREEILDLFQLAADRKVACFVHVRHGGPVEPNVEEAVQEVIADAASTGASLHVVHITSVGLRQTPTLLRMIRGSRAHGLDVTTEAYPYTAGMTDLSSAIFNEGWQQHQGGITFKDLQWAATGERLTPETFAKYRKQGGMVAIHSIPEEIARLAMADPMVMIASDSIIENGKGHPRAAGTYARVLGRYVREQHVLTLMDAIRKMTLMPAQRINQTNKGRIKVGADADITVFDRERVIDRATFENPAQYSEGIPDVLVNGVFVVKDGKLQTGAAPGRPVRRSQVH
jgi:cytosine/adenosine deaminase-related metal-dependent hydrolase